MTVVKTCWRAANMPASDAASRPFRAVVQIDQRALHLRNAFSFFRFLLLQPLRLLLPQRNPRQHPAQRGRHDHGGDDRHGDDHGVELVAQHPHRQADAGDDDLGRAAGIEPGRKRQRLCASEAAQPAASERAEKFSDAGNDDDGER